MGLKLLARRVSGVTVPVDGVYPADALLAELVSRTLACGGLLDGPSDQQG